MRTGLQSYLANSISAGTITQGKSVIFLSEANVVDVFNIYVVVNSFNTIFPSYFSILKNDCTENIKYDTFLAKCSLRCRRLVKGLDFERQFGFQDGGQVIPTSIIYTGAIKDNFLPV